MAKPGTETSPDIDVEEKLKEAFARGWSVIVWNDPVNLMDYVVYVFKAVLKMNEKDASRHMWGGPPKGQERGGAGNTGKVGIDRSPLARLRVERHHGAGMTSEPIAPGQWRVSFTEPEADFLVNVLARLGKQYQEDITRMPPTLRAYWQGTITRGEIAGKDDLKESQEVLAEARAELRGERLALVENWMREYELAEERDPWKVEISGAERDEFVAMLNDRRMLLALEAGITEEDMEADLAGFPTKPGALASSKLMCWATSFWLCSGRRFTDHDYHFRPEQI